MNRAEYALYFDALANLAHSSVSYVISHLHASSFSTHCLPIGIRTNMAQQRAEEDRNHATVAMRVDELGSLISENKELVGFLAQQA